MPTKSERAAAGRPINERGLLTKSMAADYLSVSQRTLDRMVDAGTVVPVSLRGDARRFRRADLDRLIEELEPAKRRRVGCTA